ncbi:MAG: sigma-70 family RNA polymerase sigma factor [Myxococcales bacterium]|nr:sigma-70 family RNA polymerase sigma factor [Myxococcales bacterium]MCB9755821.1 sigma-70 family RNA polymerase sigma factor [Myxococcales bacterium]
MPSEPETARTAASARGGVSDERLVARLRRGDLAAFDQLYRRYHMRLFGYVRRYVHERALAEDLFQDVFMTVLRDRTFDPERGRFAPWLFRVARNRCLQETRMRSVRTRRAALVEPAPEPAPDPEQALSRSSRVQAAMAGLSEAHRQVLVLKQVAELTYGEIAALLGIAEGTAKSRVHAATRSLRARLVELGES